MCTPEARTTKLRRPGAVCCLHVKLLLGHPQCTRLSAMSLSLYQAAPLGDDDQQWAQYA